MSNPILKIGDEITIDGFKGEVTSIQEKGIVVRGENGELREFALSIAQSPFDSQ